MKNLPVENISKLLIVRPDAIGDMILTLPAIKAIKEALPNISITVLASPINSQLIEHLPYIDEIILDKKVTSLFGFFRYVKWIKSFGFDCAVHYYSESKTCWGAYFAGIKYNLGDKAKLGLWPVLRKYGLFYRSFDQPKHVVHYNFMLAESLGIRFKDDVSLTIPVPKEGKEKAEKLLQKLGRKTIRPIVGIHLGVGGGNRPLTPEKYAYYINELSKELDCDIVITGHTEKEKEYRTVIKRLVRRSLLDCVGKTDLKTLAGVLSLLDVYVGVDTGPSHLASALERPQLAIFPSKRVKPLSWGPLNNRHFLIRNVVNCDHFCPHEHCPYTVCSDDISATDMVSKTIKLLNGEGVCAYSEQKVEWFKASLTICVVFDDESQSIGFDTRAHLNKMGFVVHSRHITSDSLFDLVTKHDVSILHNVTGKYAKRLWILSQRANPKLHNPPLVTHGDILELSAVDIVKKYCNDFQDKRL